MIPDPNDPRYYVPKQPPQQEQACRGSDGDETTSGIKLFRLVSVPSRHTSMTIEDKTFVVDKVYTERQRDQASVRYGCDWEEAGHPPSSLAPSTFQALVEFCAKWIAFIIETDLGDGRELALVALSVAYRAAAEIEPLRRPALPDAFRQRVAWYTGERGLAYRSPQPRNAAEELRELRDWAIEVEERQRQKVDHAPVPSPPAADSTQPAVSVMRAKHTLEADIERMTLTFDGKTFSVTSESAIRFVKVLADNEGVWIKASALKNYDSVLDLCKPRTLRKFIPKPIDDCIRRRQGANGGTCLHLTKGALRAR